MGKTLAVAKDRAFDQSKTVLPAEVARGIYVRNAPSLRALKLMHLMIATAGPRMAEPMRHEMRLSDIRRIEGMAHHDKSSLKPLFEELRGAVLTYDEPDAKRYTVGGFLDHAEVDYLQEANNELTVSWYFGRMFMEMAAQSDRWALIDRQTVFHLASKYSVLLFQHISSMTGMEKINSKIFSIPELRAVLGVSEDKLERFSNLNQRVLQPVIAEINELSRFKLTATPRKVGRTVVGVEIGWIAKEDPIAPKPAVTDEKPRAKPKADAEKSTREAFPSEGGIRYRPHWLGLKRAANCNMDDDMIADRFRAWCRDKGIPLDASTIERTFSSFCQRIGKV